jgi:RHS repeat-associated protein
LYQVKHNNSLLETRAYDNGGRWTSQTYGNGVVTTRTYRNDNLTTLIDVRDGSNAQLDSFAYTYDANQNKTAETRTGVMAPWGWSTGTSGYDAEDRLRAWNRTDGQLTQGWNLTLEGDWQQFTQNGTPQNRTHGLAHELTAVGGTGLTYDVKGNLTQAVTGHRYTWDFDNQLQGVDTSGDQVADVTFGYDALGRRVKKTASGATKVYVSATQPIAYSPQAGQELAEFVSGAAPTSPAEKYVYGDYIDEPIWKTGTGGGVYYHANALYCVSALTNGSGGVVERYRYTPYGELTILAADGTTVRSASNYANPYTYTGRRWDSETGLYYYRARYYHPTLGRFVGRDPLEHSKAIIHYEYARGLATTHTDPTGLKCTKPTGFEYIPGRGKFAVAFPVAKPLNNGKVEGGFGGVWSPTSSAFVDAKGCCCCNRIDWIQTIHVEADWSGAFGWVLEAWDNTGLGYQVDGDIPYPGGATDVPKTGNPCRSSTTKIGTADLVSRPTFHWELYSSLISFVLKAEVCVVCMAGPEGKEYDGIPGSLVIENLAIYGCANWGFSVSLDSSGSYKYTTPPTVYSTDVGPSQAFQDAVKAFGVRNSIGVVP